MKENEKNDRLKTVDLAYIGVFAAIIAVCSWLQIPFGAVPVTLQTFAVCAAAGLLGAKRGLLSVLSYILLGLIGVPVFSGFNAGAGVLFGVTGGYIIGFIFTALIVGLAVDKLGKKLWVYAAFMLLGVLVCYAFGTAWFIVVYTKKAEAITIGGALSMCVLPFLIPDAIKIALAAALCKALGKRIKC
jgi:biotin transport system substrate-specific component